MFWNHTGKDITLKSQSHFQVCIPRSSKAEGKDLSVPSRTFSKANIQK